MGQLLSLNHVYQEPFLPVRSAALSRSLLSTGQVRFVFNPYFQLVSTVLKCQCHQSVQAIMSSPPLDHSVRGPKQCDGGC